MLLYIFSIAVVVVEISLLEGAGCDGWPERGRASPELVFSRLYARMARIRATEYTGQVWDRELS